MPDEFAFFGHRDIKKMLSGIQAAVAQVRGKAQPERGKKHSQMRLQIHTEAKRQPKFTGMRDWIVDITIGLSCAKHLTTMQLTTHLLNHIEIVRKTRVIETQREDLCIARFHNLRRADETTNKTTQMFTRRHRTRSFQRARTPTHTYPVQQR